MTQRLAVALAALSALSAPVWAQAPEVPVDATAPKPEQPSPKRLRVHAEIKANFRHSAAEEVLDKFPFPPSFLPPDGIVALRTTSPGSSLELSDASLSADADLTPNIEARVAIHFLDLYNRNPTSSDDRVFVREAWLRFGHKYEPRAAMPGTSIYLLVGKAPRFTKQIDRRLESYGLWGTAVARFEEVQIEAGGSFGTHLYWRGQVASPNPIFFRDPNALAGDNGTPDRVPGNVHPILQSGFPILYDAKAPDLNLSDGHFQVGGGAGVRFMSESGKKGIDAVGWYFQRTLVDQVPIRGSIYFGDIRFFQNFTPFGIAFDLQGRRKQDYGINLDGQLGGAHVFGQYIRQDIAGLKRHGYEAETSFHVELPGLVSGDTPIFNWLEPVVRVSHIKNDFVTPPLYPGPSVGWDWTKYDFGIRLGIVGNVDLTAEYARNDARLFNGSKIHPDEALVTLRAGF